ncbi:hypothetical protein HZA76_04745 [Candidatus Roizmanbacteria bacterium]|nr:hypothetical protein [Candidatus Roizmanbacteria bacterium]
MKKIIISIILLVVTLFFKVGPAKAGITLWDLTGTYTVDFNLGGGHYIHTMDIDTVDLFAGTFSGTGFYNTNPAYTWNVTGTINDANVLFTIVYTGLNPGYTVHATGTIASDGSMSGTATGPGQNFTWMTTSGTATLTDVGLEWGSKLTPPSCEAKGKPLVNVTYKVQNTVDSGEGGNYWAYDNLNRHIQLWQTGESTYCAVVKFEGKYNTIAGTSPGNTGTVPDDLKGSFQGGYKAIITGSFLSSPLWKTNGNLGTIDYQCDASANCPGAVDWVEQYFNHDSNTGFSQPWWGWIYHGGHHGTWINSSDGNLGDITE